MCLQLHHAYKRGGRRMIDTRTPRLPQAFSRTFRRRRSLLRDRRRTEPGCIVRVRRGRRILLLARDPIEIKIPFRQIVAGVHASHNTSVGGGWRDVRLSSCETMSTTGAWRSVPSAGVGSCDLTS
eukprot:1074986-Rhodomonas_salina.1